ncbi:MAG: pseudaminic acid cytidylyltransferase [Chitinophagaceae bacterium]|nr:pseudaminic acid cytidylyltransferase [Chitinophagaceae bacterium]
MANLCIIPARGGSKRIPKKNSKMFLGKPVIAYAIAMAKQTKLFDIIMVSTDDEDIAAIARANGAEIPFMRSAVNSSDVATTYDVLAEVLEWYAELGDVFINGCCIYPCTPLLKPENVIEGHNKLTAENYDTVISLVKYATPVQRAYTISNNKLSMMYQEYANTRSQDLTPAYYDAGQFYWFKAERLLHNKTLIGNNMGAVILNETEVQDIDNETDWTMAELKYKNLKNTDHEL